MRVLAIKALRDLRRERGRAALVVLAVATGIAGFFGVLSAWAILTRELTAGYAVTNPASIIVRTDSVDDTLVRAVLGIPDLAFAEPRRIVSGRIRSSAGSWKRLSLSVVGDYRDLHVSRILPERGAWPPGPGEILIERDALGVARARIGDAVEVVGPHGSPRTLRLTGTAHDVGQAQARMEHMVYGYVTLETLALLGEEPVFDRLYILVSGDRGDADRVQRVAARVRDVFEEHGRPVTRVDVPEPGKHPHAAIMGLLLLSMAVFGFAVLLLSSVLVVNLVTALMAAETRSIGILKALGGSRASIVRHYLGQSAALGAAALVLGVPAGLIGGRALARALAVFLNFDITSESIPPWLFLLAVSAGLLVPVLAGLGPVWRASGVSARDALVASGISGDTFGEDAFDRALAGFDGASRPVLLALRNGFRMRARLVRTLVTLALAGIFFMTALGVKTSLGATVDRLFRARHFDLSLSTGSPAPLETIARAVAATPGIAAWEGWISAEGKSPRVEFSVFALPPSTRMLTPDIAEGRGLGPGDVDVVVVNSALLAKSPDFKVGGDVVFRIGPDETRWHVVGEAREPLSPPIAYIPLASPQSQGQRRVANALRLALVKTDEASIEAVKATLERNLEAEGLKASGALSTAESRYSLDQHMLMIYVFLLVVSAVLGVVGTLGLATTMSLNVLERRRELGVLRALGATPGAIRALLVAESCAVAIFAWAIACAVALPLGWFVGSVLARALVKGGLEPGFAFAGPAIWLGASLVTGVVASLLPAWRASRRPITEALKWE